MQCPHCRVSFHPQFGTVQLKGHNSRPLSDAKGSWVAISQTCPACNQAIVILQWGTYENGNEFHVDGEQLGYPSKILPAPLPPEVPKELASDFDEASLVLLDSPKASAALSRRCFQNLLRNYAGVNQGDLFDEIKQVLDSKTLPSPIVEALDAVRRIGNLATHPTKSKTTGEIVDVEPGEAQWNLDTLEALFDHYFIKPARLKSQKKALDEKLQKARKSPTK